MSAPDSPRTARAGALAFTLSAAAAAAVTGLLIWRLLSAGGYGREPLKPVVVAARAISAGRPLRAEDLRLAWWPASAVAIGASDKIEPLLTRVPTAGLFVGEPVLKERLASPSAGPGLAALVRPSARAVAVKLEREMVAAKLLYPGAHVDVIATFRDGAGMSSTRTILKNIRVLAVGTFADIEAARRGVADESSSSRGSLTGGDGADAVVSFEVSPVQAERLSLAAREGRIDVALRHASDDGDEDLSGVMLSDLVPAPLEKATPPAPPRPVDARPSRTRWVAHAAPPMRLSGRDPGNGDQHGSIEVYHVPSAN